MVLSPPLLRRVACRASVAALFVMFLAHPTAAQDDNMPPPLTSRALSIRATTALELPLTPPPVDFVPTPQPLVSSASDGGNRPSALLPLYVSLASLQVLDVVSTRRALNRGAFERNPIVEPLTNSTPALIALKAGSTAAIIYLTERLWNRQPVAAVVLMVGLNAGYASLVAHNFSVKRR